MPKKAGRPKGIKQVNRLYYKIEVMAVEKNDTPFIAYFRTKEKSGSKAYKEAQKRLGACLKSFDKKATKKPEQGTAIYGQ